MPFSLVFAYTLPDDEFMSGQNSLCPESDVLQIDDLRALIRSNQVSFPVPVPIFTSEYRADVQWRLAELYFVHGWSPARLAERYDISTRRVRQSLHSWVCRARTKGYLQWLAPEPPSAEQTLS